MRVQRALSSQGFPRDKDRPGLWTFLQKQQQQQQHGLIIKESLPNITLIVVIGKSAMLEQSETFYVLEKRLMSPKF